MSVRIDPIPDDRAERMMRDPAGYFAEARERIRAEVEREMAEERKARRWWRR